MVALTTSPENHSNELTAWTILKYGERCQRKLVIMDSYFYA